MRSFTLLRLDILRSLLAGQYIDRVFEELSLVSTICPTAPPKDNHLA
ncbi:MAG TPA: hypothetical protein VKX46_00805 [Ktedonobacteraceae bacterium]|nr:hypothetical protein [Ktedonobacteraceae bacterium]